MTYYKMSHSYYKTTHSYWYIVRIDEDNIIKNVSRIQCGVIIHEIIDHEYYGIEFQSYKEAKLRENWRFELLTDETLFLELI